MSVDEMSVGEKASRQILCECVWNMSEVNPTKEESSKMF